jgi:SAM-dependent methyltransferase
MNIFRKLFFLLWYYRDPPWDTHQTPPELFAFIQSNPPGLALDLGCGTGTNVITLVQHGWQATGVDFIPKAIRQARRRAARAGVQADFYIGDVTRLTNLKKPFDLILDMGCYQSLDPSGMAAYRRNIQRLLAPAGTFLIYLFFRSADALSGSGATEEDLTPFLEFLDLVNRQDGTERGVRPSAWLTFYKPAA